MGVKLVMHRRGGAAWGQVAAPLGPPWSAAAPVTGSDVHGRAVSQNSRVRLRQESSAPVTRHGTGRPATRSPVRGTVLVGAVAPARPALVGCGGHQYLPETPWAGRAEQTQRVPPLTRHGAYSWDRVDTEPWSVDLSSEHEASELSAHEPSGGRGRGRGGPAGIEARAISKHFETRAGVLPALVDVSLAAGAGEFVSIIGPSGCGKTTLFNILAGLEPPSSGGVLLDGVERTSQPSGVGYMLQKDLLLPWKSTLDNAALGLQLQGVSWRRAREEARGWFPRFGLEGFEREYPHALSGGMRQRVALLRTFLARRAVLLLDEPFGALDALTRAEMQGWLLDVWTEFGKTIVLVTHDVEEAIFLSDRVYVMTPRPGRIAAAVEIALPRPRVYDEAVTSVPFLALKRKLLDSLRSLG